MPGAPPALRDSDETMSHVTIVSAMAVLALGAGSAAALVARAFTAERLSRAVVPVRISSRTRRVSRGE